MNFTEYAHEPIPGLPGELPAGEEIRWQGAPEWKALARHAFHVRKVMAYFGVLVAWRLVEAGMDGMRGVELAAAASWPLAFGIAAVGILSLLAWLNARATRYTITSRRVVLRFGVALPIARTLPLRMIESAALRRAGEHAGSIALKLVPTARVSYLVGWPHMRPWSFTRPEPMLRDIPDADAVARILADCWAQAPGTQSVPTPPASRDFAQGAAGLAA